MPAAKLTDLIGEIKHEKAHHDLWQAVDSKYRAPSSGRGTGSRSVSSFPGQAKKKNSRLGRSRLFPE